MGDSPGARESGGKGGGFPHLSSGEAVASRRRHQAGTGASFRAVALDLDGTLLRSDKTAGAANVGALQRTSKAGIVVVLASSRGPGGLRQVLAELGVGVLAATYGGALLLDASSPARPPVKVAPERTLDPVLALELLGEAYARGASVHWYANDSWYVRRLDPSTQRQAIATGEQPELVASFAQLPPPHKVMAIAMDADQIGALRVLAARLPQDVGEQYTRDDYLELISAEADKGTGVATLLATRGIEMREVIAIGDAPNDLPLFRRAGLTVAVGNAYPVVREQADRVVATNDENGVADALDSFLTGPLDYLVGLHAIRKRVKYVSGEGA